MPNVFQKNIPHFSERKSEYAWDFYKKTVLTFSKNRKVLEIGAGRTPIFSEKEIQKYKINFVANDISESELGKGKINCEKAVFDICGKIPEKYLGQFDFVCSKMVLEHVNDGKKYWKNVHSLLRKGGMCLTFHPTLFCPPFVVNFLLPEKTAYKTLLFFFPQTTTKFPAYYSFCFSTKNNLKKIKKLGFSDAECIPFYYHGYFKNIPIIKQVDDLISYFSMKYNIRFLSSYAYTIVQK